MKEKERYKINEWWDKRQKAIKGGIRAEWFNNKTQWQEKQLWHVFIAKKRKKKITIKT